MEIGHRLAGTIGLGTAQFAFKDESEARSIATVEAALDAGILLIDTALAYTRPGVESYAEGIVRSALAARKDDAVLVATKGGHWRDGDHFPIDGTAERLRAHCAISLRTLGVERIALYQLHHLDPLTPLEESVAALGELRDEGKIDMIGLSNATVAQVQAAREIAPISSVQNRLSVFDRADLDVAHWCAANGIAYLAYMPLGGPERTASLSRLEAIAARRAVSWQQVAIAWLRTHEPGILPLVGASRPESIRDSAAATWTLDAAELEELAQ
jgi:aryl-alcohol dehydrogenase-like predicted oxidoreductase